MEKDEVKEYIALAVQAGKQETSGLVSHLEKFMDKKIGEAIEKYVNGHLRDIKEHLEGQDDILAGLKKDLAQIKKDTDPLVETQKTASSLVKFIKWIGGVAVAVWAIIKFFPKI